MKKECKSTADIVLLFQTELSPRYPDLEIKSILYQLFEAMLGWSRANVQLNRGTILADEIVIGIMDALGRLTRGEPIQYIIGSSQFCGLTLTVDRSVLIPRPETEELATLVVRENQKLRKQSINILDIGTGSGCLALALKTAFPSANVTGIDISRDALVIASRNARENTLDITFLEEDIHHPSPSLTSPAYNIIISNPPYIPLQEKATMSSHVVDYEPETALFVPDHNPLLYYKSIASFARRALASNGLVYVEIHENFGGQTVTLFQNQGFNSVEVLRDFFGKKRFVRASVTDQKN